MPNYRRIIDAYRTKLMEVSPAACNEVDDQMWAEGEKWLVNDAPVKLDRFVTAAEFADRFGFTEQNVRDWARRHPDKITTHKTDGKALYLTRELLAYLANRG